MGNKELYDKVLTTYKSGDENAFHAAARNWVVSADYGCFSNPEANDLLTKAKGSLKTWAEGGIASRRSRIVVFECVEEIAKMGLPNPYQETPKEVPVNDPIHVLGVIPEKTNINDIDSYVLDDSNFIQAEKEHKEQIKENVKEEIEEQPKEEQKRLFRRKKR